MMISKEMAVDKLLATRPESVQILKRKGNTFEVRIRW